MPIAANAKPLNTVHRYENLDKYVCSDRLTIRKPGEVKRSLSGQFSYACPRQSKPARASYGHDCERPAVPKAWKRLLCYKCLLPWPYTGRGA